MGAKEIIDNISNDKFAEAKSDLRDIVKERVAVRVAEKQLELGFIVQEKKVVEQDDDDEKDDDDKKNDNGGKKKKGGFPPKKDDDDDDDKDKDED